MNGSTAVFIHVADDDTRAGISRGRPSPGRSGSRDIPIITREGLRSVTWATSGPRTRTARPSSASPTTARGKSYPRFSPDGRWIAFSSNRYGNYDVFVVPAAGGTPVRLTYHTGTDDVVGWTRDSQQIIFRSARGDGAFPNVAVLYQIPVTGGMEKPLPLDWGYWGSYSPDGRVAGVQSSPGCVVTTALSRQLRGRPLDCQPGEQHLHETPRRRALQPLLADVGRRRRDLLSSPIRCRTTRASRRAASTSARAPTTSTRFPRKADSPSRSRSTPTATSSGRRCRATGKSSSTKTTSESGSWMSHPAARTKSSSTSRPTKRKTRSTSRP